MLEAHSDGTYTVTDEKAAFPTTIEQLEPDHEFRIFFTELSILVQNRKQKLDDVLNDTKNYQNRFSANIKNDCLHIFYEEFNYSMPERNEYYLMEYVDGHYQLSIAYRSMFMQEYLTPDQYYLHYRTHKAIPRKTYASLEEIDKTFDEKGRSYFYPDLQKYRKRAFCRMKKIVEEKLQDLQQERIFIQNFDYIFDDPTEVLKWYEAEELFHCTYDSEFGAIDSCDESIQYTDANGESTEITFDDIILAFKLGINSISEISRIKIQKGSISSLLV